MAASVPLSIIVHIQGIGDLLHHESEWAGTKGQARRLEGFQINGASLQYMAHIQDIGDTSWTAAGQFVGTRGSSKRLEGFAINLLGALSSTHVVSYRAHLEGIGDTGWSTNGAFCGTRHQSRRLEAMWVDIYPIDT